MRSSYLEKIDSYESFIDSAHRRIAIKKNRKKPDQGFIGSASIPTGQSIENAYSNSCVVSCIGTLILLAVQKEGSLT